MKHEIAAAFGFEGLLLERVSLADRLVDVVVEIDEAECARREQAGVDGADRDVLRLMAVLPYREKISLNCLDAFTRALLAAKGQGFVRFDRVHVERIWKPALEIRGFLVVSSDWRNALRRVSLFAADAPRAVAYTGATKLTDATRRAGQLGVGLAQVRREVEVLVQPERHLVVHDEIRWALLERLFQLMLRRRDIATA